MHIFSVATIANNSINAYLSLQGETKRQNLIYKPETKHDFELSPLFLFTQQIHALRCWSASCQKVISLKSLNPLMPFGIMFLSNSLGVTNKYMIFHPDLLFIHNPFSHPSCILMAKSLPISIYCDSARIALRIHILILMIWDLDPNWAQWRNIRMCPYKAIFIVFGRFVCFFSGYFTT